MKFKEDNLDDIDDEDNETELVEMVSSTWISEDRKKSYWPPKTVPMDRAGRMAYQHVQPDPATWQRFDITFVNSYSKSSVFILFHANSCYVD